jgi:L-ribulose-5-phosphate 3-epimerase
MLKGINYWAFLPEANGSPKPLSTAFQCARDLGFDCFELTVDETGPLTFASSRQQVDDLRRAAEDIGIKLVTLATLLSWSCSPTHPDLQVRQRSIASHQRLLEIASWFGVETVLYIPGMVSAWWLPAFTPQPYDLVDQWARQALDQLVPTAEKLKVKIGIENVANRFLMSPLEMRDLIDSFHSPFVGSYLDIGNALIYGYPEHWIKILGRRIFAVHLKDYKTYANGGFAVDLLGGDVNYPAVVRALDEIGYAGPQTAEIVPAKMGGVEKAAAAIKMIETIKGKGQ